jgi:DNA-binding IscR family transcriptional regulator
MDILYATEASLFETTEVTVPGKLPEIEATMQAMVFESIDSVIKENLQKITLYDLVSEAEKHKKDQGFMFFI